MKKTDYSEFKAIQKSAVLCWLATTHLDGSPSVSPKEVWSLFEKESIIIANIASPGSIKNILSNPAVCLSFIDVFVQKGYKVKGHAIILKPGDETYKEKHQALYKIAGETYPFKSIIDIRINHISPIMAPSYFIKPDESVKDKIKSAMATYGVQSL